MPRSRIPHTLDKGLSSELPGLDIPLSRSIRRYTPRTRYLSRFLFSVGSLSAGKEPRAMRYDYAYGLQHFNDSKLNSQILFFHNIHLSLCLLPYPAVHPATQDNGHIHHISEDTGYGRSIIAVRCASASTSPGDHARIKD